MTHFSNITSFAELKKQYRTLAIANHPDKGGDVKVMQEINAEFEKLFKVWEHRKDEVSGHTGYENDYNGATASEYTNYVYNEYKWVGHRYKGQNNTEILDLVRQWIKKTYPHYKFWVRRHHYGSFTIQLLQADFEPFVPEESARVRYDLNYFYIKEDKILTEEPKK